MKDLWTIQHEAIKKMDAACEKVGVGWNNGAQEIRGVLIDAIVEGVQYGREIGRISEVRKNCKHEFAYDREGGVCVKCGEESLKDSSD